MRKNKEIIFFICAIVIAVALYAKKNDLPGILQDENTAQTETVGDGNNPKKKTKAATKRANDAGKSSAKSAKEIEESSKRVSYELPAFDENKEMIIRHTGFTLSYNKKHNTPNWVAWHLTKSHTTGDQTRSTKFWADPDIPTAYRVDYYEYKDSGYDRGHMCPAGDNKWSRNAMHDCFYMSNMCPQVPKLNSGSWGKLEEACRRWAVTEGSVYIVCGPVFKKGVKHEQIGITHAIDVPEGFFKAVLSLRKGSEKAIAFYYENTTKGQPMATVAMTVDEIERICGLDLFEQLDDSLENRLEGSARLADWK